MARPKKTGLDYFPVDTSFDLSMEAYIAQTGAEGVGLWLILMQNIYREGGFFRLTPTTEMYITGRARMTKQEFQIHLDHLFTLGLLDRKQHETNGILTGRGVQSRYFAACLQMRREIVFPELYRVITEETPVITEETPLIPAKSTQTKVKESKEEETPLPPLRADAVSPELKPLPIPKPEPTPDPPGGRLTPFVTEFKAVYPNKDGLHHAEMAFARAVLDDKADPELLVKKAKQYAWLIEKTDPTQKMFKAKNWLERKEYMNDYGQLWKDFKAKKAAEGDDEKPFYKPILNQ